MLSAMEMRVFLIFSYLIELNLSTLNNMAEVLIFYFHIDGVSFTFTL